jgi:hypothetical protein
MKLTTVPLHDDQNCSVRVDKAYGVSETRALVVSRKVVEKADHSMHLVTNVRVIATLPTPEPADG